MAKYVPIKDLDELLSARAAGVLWCDCAPELAKERELRHWWEIAVKNESDGFTGSAYILPKDWSILVEDDEEGDSPIASGASAEDE